MKKISERGRLRDRSEWWSQLPSDMKVRVLAWLPAERLCRYCAVCKEWNALLSSTQFITNDWVAAFPNDRPWRVLFHDLQSLNCTVYRFFTHTWERLSLDFLKKKYDVRGLQVHATAAGLFLATIRYFNADTRSYVFTRIVFNPLTRKSIELPRICDGAIWVTATIAEDYNGGTYKVIAIVNLGDVKRVEIYDPILKSWRTAGDLPQNCPILWTKRFVVSGDFMYVISFRWIVVFNIENGTSDFAALPVQGVGYKDRCDVLFTCGSQVFLASCIWCVGRIFISELENSRLTIPGYIEYTKMPQSILDSRRRHALIHYASLMFDFDGTEDFVCIRDRHSNEVLVYSLNKCIWSWFPRCPTASELSSSFLFEPRPDMDVE